ncbi:MAG: type II toxin-antitoxin system YafQ family toxin [Raoultibacter sp.]
MLAQKSTTQFKKDIKRIKSRHWDTQALKNLMVLLANEEEIPIENYDHVLGGNWKGHRELHVGPDFLLVYRIEGSILYFSRTGSHSDIFA